MQTQKRYVGRLMVLVIPIILFGMVLSVLDRGETAVAQSAPINIFLLKKVQQQPPTAPEGFGLSFSKTFSPDTIGAGSTTLLTFDISNPTSIIANNIAFTDNLPAGVILANPANASTDCIDAVLSAPDGGSTITFADGRMPAFGSCTATVYVTGTALGTHTNTTSNITSSFGSNAPATDDLNVVTDRPTFSKSFAPDVINQGGRSTLTFLIDNTAGTANITSLSFTDNLPAGLVIADPSNLSTDCPDPQSNSSLTANPGSDSISYSVFGFNFGGFEILTPGESCSVVVDVLGTGRGTLTNLSSLLTAGINGSAQSVGYALDQITINATDLGLTKSFLNDPVTPGDTVNLEFTLINRDRNNDVTNITFTDDLNATLPGLVATGLPLSNICGTGSTLSGSTVLTLSGGALVADGGTCTFNVTLQVPVTASTGIYTNTTSSASGDAGVSTIIGLPATDSLFVQTVPLVTKTFITDTVGAGDTTTMQFVITNTSTTDPMTDIAFQDNLSAFFSGIVASNLPPVGSCGAGSNFFLSSSGGSDFFNVSGANLTAGASCTFTVDLTVPVGAPPGTYTNNTTQPTATVNGSTVTGQAATDDLTVVAGPDLSKTFIDDPVQPGDNVTLVFTITNSTTNTATNIAFTDNLAAMGVSGGVTATGLPISACNGGTLSGTTSLSFTGGSLTAGASCTFSATLTVSASALPGDYTNTTSNLTADVLGASVTENPTTDELTVSGIEFTKEFITNPHIAGQTATLRFVITNTSSTASLSGMFFSDDLGNVIPGMVPNNLPLTDPCGAGSSASLVGGDIISFNGGNLGPNSSCTFDVTMVVPPATSSGSYGNITSNLVVNVDGSPTTIDPATDILIVDNEPILFSKEFIDDPVNPGDNVTLVFTMTNANTTNGATAIAFTDDLDAALSGLAPIGLPASFCGGTLQELPAGTLDFSGGTLAAGATCNITVTLTVPASTPFGTTATNVTSQPTATINGFPVSGNTASDDLLITDAVRLEKAFSNGGVSVAGGTIDLAFTITNLSVSNTASSLAFQDDLSAMLAGTVATGLPLSACNGGTLSGSSFLSFTGGSLAPLEVCTFTTTLQIPITAVAGTYLNRTSALLQAGLQVDEPATDNLIIDPPPAFSKNFAPDPIYAGETSTLLFTIDNTASSFTATNLIFTDTLPAGLVIATPANDLTTCTGGTLTAVSATNTITYTGGTIGAGSACFLQVDTTTDTAGVYTNTSGILTSSNGFSTVATDTLTVDPSANLLVIKSDSPDPVIAGNILTYLISVFNAGPSDATNVILTDTLPSGVTLFSTTGCAEDPTGIPTCSVGTIPASTGVTVTLLVTVNGNVSGTIINNIVVGSDTYDPDTGGNSDSEDTTVLNYDFGDAPAPYPTLLLASDGARHETGSLRLGTAVDSDPDGQPTANADGDDTDADGDDEDGVTFTSALVTSSTTTLDVSSTGAGLLNVWIDFNGNGDWADAGEQIFTDEAVVAGTNSLSFAVPNSAAVGTTYMRFRLDTAGGLSYTGAATDGEVEDYAVEILDTRFSIGDLALAEGNAGTTAFNFTITRTNNGSSASVVVQTADNTALSTGDYAPISTTVNFANGGALTQQVTVNITGDLTYELDETFFVNISNPFNGIISDTQGVGTILNDDAPPQFSVDDSFVNEVDGFATFTVSLDVISSLDASVDYATSDGTAVSPNDYTTSTGTVTITAGLTQTTFTVPIIDDTLFEATETFTASLSNPVNATIAVTDATGTITDNDTPPQLSIDSITVDEAVGNATFTVSLDVVSGLDASVDYATSDGTAVSPLDYTASSGTVTITAGLTQTTFTVPIIDDILFEASETFTATLSNPVLATIAVTDGIGTITNNDAPPVANISNGIAMETAPQLPITVTLDAVSGLDAILTYTTSDDTATAGSDYVASTGVITIPAGQISATINIPIIDDTLDENNETFTVTLSSPINATIGDGAGTALIVDDEDPSVILFVTDQSVDESAGTLDFTVVMAPISGLDVFASAQTTDNTATATEDYQPISSTLFIPAGSSSGTISVPIIDDLLDEPAGETFTMTLSNPINATIFDGVGVGTIVDNDDPPVLSVADVTVDEGVGTAVMTANLDAPTSFDVSFNYSPVDGTALIGQDLTGAGGSRVIPAGETSITLTITIIDDVIDENDETFGLNITSLTNATLGTVGTGTITDNDDPPNISINDVTVDEAAGNATLTLTLDAVSGLDASVDYATSDGTATAGNDYTSTSGNVTISAGTLSNTVTVAITDDLLDELTETFTIDLSNGNNVSIADGVGIVTITDNDTPPTLSINDVTVDEFAGTADLTISLDAVSGLDVSVDYQTLNGTAIAGQDYVSAVANQVIPAGNLTGTISISLIDDLLDENAETFQVELSNAVNATLVVSTGVVTILDDDPVPSISIDDVTANEADGIATFTVSIDAISGLDVGVDYDTSDGTAIAGSDYLSATGRITITAGTTSTTISVNILKDVIQELDETYFVNLSNPVNAVLADDQGQGTITDNDLISVGFALAEQAVDEGVGTAVISVTLSNSSDIPVTVDYMSQDGTAIAGDDYTAISGTVAFAANETVQTIALPITDDALYELPETLTLMLSNPVNAELGVISETVVTIVDNESAPEIAFSAVDYNVQEEAGQATITVTLSAVSAIDASVDYSTADGTATAGADYTASSGTVTILAGETAVTFNIPISSDSIDEGDETFTVSLSNAVSATIGTPMTATVTIEDNDVTLFMPVIMNEVLLAPDLVVSDLSNSGSTIEVVVTNQGNVAVTDSFWVDVYIAPDSVPTAVNQTWPIVGQFGMVWGVDNITLAPGESLTLSFGDSFYDPNESTIPATIAAGTLLYAQVDSAHTGTTFGNVLESHEITGAPYNNISAFTATVTVDGIPTVENRASQDGAGLPPRPN